MPVWAFRIGDVFDPDDSLAVWACTLAVAFNDLVHANIKVAAASSEWERFYEWRVATGHYNETCLHLRRGLGEPSVRAFLAAEPEVAVLHERALSTYDTLRPLTNRIRNEAAFHYAYRSGRLAIAQALRELADETGEMGGAESTKIKDSRQFYADDVVAQLVLAASGGTVEAYAGAMQLLAEGVAVVARFANHALDAYFYRHADALKLKE